MQSCESTPLRAAFSRVRRTAVSLTSTAAPLQPVRFASATEIQPLPLPSSRKRAPGPLPSRKEAAASATVSVSGRGIRTPSSTRMGRDRNSHSPTIYCSGYPDACFSTSAQYRAAGSGSGGAPLHRSAAQGRWNTCSSRHLHANSGASAPAARRRETPSQYRRSNAFTMRRPHGRPSSPR